MSSEYWIKRENQVKGPYSSSELKNMASASEIFIDDQISKDQNNWMKIGALKALRKSSDNGEEVADYRTHVQQFDIKHFIQKHGQTAWEPATFYINCIGPKNWQFKLTAKGLSHAITFPIDQFDERTEISKDIFIVCSNMREEQFHLTEKAIEAIDDRLMNWEMALSNCPKICPSCKKEGYANGVCLNCGYIRKARLFFFENWLWYCFSHINRPVLFWFRGKRLYGYRGFFNRECQPLSRFQIKSS